VEYHDSIGSTNARARALASDGAADVVVLADEQTGGRGRLQRAWASPSGGVWLSVLLRPALPPASVPLLTLAAGVATVRAVEPAGVEPRLKWPNDVLVAAPDGSEDELKIAGILTEMAGEADRTEWVVVGIGVNANVDPESLPPGATSLRELVGDAERRSVVQRLLREFDSLRGAPDAVLPAWRRVSSTLGRRVRVTAASGDVVGEATDVEFPGRLVVETDDGPVRVHAGDCEHLRPA
jgi:BirA family biotin operon repressor/biotin-[acetyl-CoA-carboxylase] ligase